MKYNKQKNENQLKIQGKQIILIRMLQNNSYKSTHQLLIANINYFYPTIINQMYSCRQVLCLYVPFFLLTTIIHDTTLKKIELETDSFRNCSLY